MNVSVRLFARARELAGADEVALEVPETATIDDVRSALVVRVPELDSLARSLLFAVGTDYATASTRIRNSDQIACFPPVSGG